MNLKTGMLAKSEIEGFPGMLRHFTTHKPDQQPYCLISFL